MNNSKGIFISIILGLCAIICTSILSFSFLTYTKTRNTSGVTATGSASCNFESDLIVWRGSFSATGDTSAAAYDTIKTDSELIKEYLLNNNVTNEEIVFSSVNICQNFSPIYNDNGDYVGDIADGYTLSQEVSITSNDVDKVEKISRDISALIESGVEFTSNSPEYYYTKLDELKLELIQRATDNAKQRVDIITENSGATKGELLSANLGVFQITAQNSASEEYSYGGTFNTSSRLKTATITVNLNYSLK